MSSRQQYRDQQREFQSQQQEIVDDPAGIEFDSDLALSPADYGKKFVYIGTSGSVTVTLPTSLDVFNTFSEGWYVNLKNDSRDGSNITIAAGEASTVDNVSSIAFDFGELRNVEWEVNTDNFNTKLGSGGAGGGGGTGGQISDVISETTATLIYIGFNDDGGDWKVKKYERDNTNNLEIADEPLNPAYTDLTTAFANRATLVYV